MPATTSVPAAAGRLALRTRVLLTLLALLAGTALAFAPARAAHAMLPDAWGYGYYDPSAPAPGPLTDTLTSVGSGGQVVSAAGNSYLVEFPKVGAKQGVVHVTAISRTGNPTPQPPSWCEPDAWYLSGSDEFVKVTCWVISGGTAVPFPTGFVITYVSATFSGPPVPDFAYAQSDGGSSLLTQFNSSGAPLSVGHIGTGLWTIQLPGVGPGGTTLGGDFQVTGEGGAAPARCKVGRWVNSGGTQSAVVFCFNGGTGAPMDTGWSLTYQFKLNLHGQAPKAWGYFLQQAGAPVLTNFDSLNGWGTASSAPTPPAGITVLFPSIGFSAKPYATANVTTFGSGPEFCRLGELGGPPPWVDNSGTLQIRSVDCFTGSGTSTAKVDFFVSYTSK